MIGGELLRNTLRASGGARDPHAHSSALRSLRGACPGLRSGGGHPQRAAPYALPRPSNFRCSPTARPMGGVRRCSGSSRISNVRCGPCAPAATAHRPLAEPAPDPDPGALPENWSNRLELPPAARRSRRAESIFTVEGLTPGVGDALPENCSSSTSLELRASGDARDPHAQSSALRSLRGACPGLRSGGGHPQRAVRYALPRPSNFRRSPTARPRKLAEDSLVGADLDFGRGDSIEWR